ncbi:MAG: DUF3369 domain-containing protein, partial [Bacteroidota bacterium]|nr:DUF3369 domain-containing protein [Bacteroidota bacterium]
MRKALEDFSSDINIAILDDEIGIIDSISVVLKRIGYANTGFTDPCQALDSMRKKHYDMLILDYLMEAMHGDEVVSKIREFDSEIYILLLTGHKDLAPPLETIRKLEIQGYCEKSDNFDQLTLLIESGIKSILQLRRIKKFENGLNKILNAIPKIYQLKPIGNILEEVLMGIMPLVNSKNAFILYDGDSIINSESKSIVKGIGKYKSDAEDFFSSISLSLIEAIGVARQEKKVINLKGGIVFPLINELQQ